MLPTRTTFTITCNSEDEFDDICEGIKSVTLDAYSVHDRSAEFRIDINSLGQDTAFEWLAEEFNQCLAQNSTEDNFRSFLCGMAAAIRNDADFEQAAAIYVALTSADVSAGHIETMLCEDEYHVESDDDHHEAWTAMGRHCGWDDCPSDFEDYVDWNQYGRDNATSSVEINGTLYVVKIYE